MKENRDFKGVWIPKEIWLNTDLSIIEKVLLVEIDSLDNSERGCFASNEYLAKFVQLSESRVAHIISDLKKNGYIIVVFTDGRNRGLKLHPQQSRFAKNSKAESLKTTKQSSQKQQHNNTGNSTEDNIAFTKVNARIEQNNVHFIYDHFAAYAEAVEHCTGVTLPRSSSGHFHMSAREAKAAKSFMEYISKITNGEASSVDAAYAFVRTAWEVSDKYQKPRFTMEFVNNNREAYYLQIMQKSPDAKVGVEAKRHEELVDAMFAKINDG